MYSSEIKTSALVRLAYTGSYQFNPKNNAVFEIINNLLQISLFYRLRQREGGTYDLSTSMRYTKIPKSRFCLQIDFETKPEKVDQMIKSVREEVTQISLNVNEASIKQAVSAAKVTIKSNLNSTAFWEDYLVRQYKNGDDPKQILEIEYLLDTIKSGDISEFAKKFLVNENFMSFLFLPKTCD